MVTYVSITQYCDLTLVLHHPFNIIPLVQLLSLILTGGFILSCLFICSLNRLQPLASLAYMQLICLLYILIVFRDV